MEISDTITDPRSRRQWTIVSVMKFGPRVELIRMSNYDRNHRFVLAMPVKVDGKWQPVILGNGCDWRAAYRCAVQSEPGKAAADEWAAFTKKLEEETKNDDERKRSEAAPS